MGVFVASDVATCLEPDGRMVAGEGKLFPVAHDYLFSRGAG